ncbi:uncharacterized protein N7518_009723 [Penicillium psychrosexuale]|uniref:uncharacterized protein n=1 Tax=Penicillium psychrosexuale TaxID=1002107 RepID=UPI002545BA5A|nr:uncharacterized protein N7518_009723 [Penicillium psychrosexuale]KAJ5784046.1 hypothetical protein N7518_009723 [Penicillium psychrosexuale]
MDFNAFARGFDQPMGHDTQGDNELRQWKPSVISFGNSFVNVKSRLVLESQQPRLEICIGKRVNGLLIFTAEDCDFHFAREGIELDDAETFRQYRASLPRIFADGKRVWDTAYLVKVHMRRPPVVIGFPPENASPSTLQDWERLLGVQDNLILWGQWSDPAWRFLSKGWKLMSGLEYLLRLPFGDTDPVTLNSLLRRPYGSIDPATLAPPQAFWFYRKHPANQEPRVVPKWLEDPSGVKPSIVWQLPGPYFLNDHDRQSRLVQASYVERAFARDLVTSVFNLNTRHRAIITTISGNGMRHRIHVKLNCEGRPPTLTAMASVSFLLLDEISAAEPVTEGDFKAKGYKGTVVDDETLGDFIIDYYGHLDWTDESERKIVMTTKPNTLPIDQQIAALTTAGTKTLVYGDKGENHGLGFSLSRTILAHGTELNFTSPDYFILSIEMLSSLPSQIAKERLQYVRNFCHLDPTQEEAFTKSTTAITVGVSLIHGPPGTGKTTTAVAIVLAMMALQIKVLLTSASNKGVDNLTLALIRALNRDSRLKSWCGQVVRFRTPSYHMSAVRAESQNQRPTLRRQPIISQSDLEMEPIQMHSLVFDHIAEHPNDPECVELRELCDRDTSDNHPLNLQDVIKLKSLYGKIVCTVLAKSKVVATTLSNASQECLKFSDFKPSVNVSDEAGQSMEGESMIPMTMESMRVIVLIGDPRQLPPTVLSDGANEGSEFLKRSLLSRLMEAGYPQETLVTNYRNHPQILELFNKAIYSGKLASGSNVNHLDRVGRTWDAWTRHAMPTVAPGSRRLFLSVDSVAFRPANETSWSNMAQVQAVQTLLENLYNFQSTEGEQIGPSDVMIISPYTAQRNLVAATLAETERGCLYRDNLTVDAAQGQEAPIVVVLLTKPSEVAEEVRFIADQHRLNVALSRAQKAIVVVGNARLWPENVIQNIERRSKHNKFFAGTLRLLTAKGNRHIVHSQQQAGPATSSNATSISNMMDVDSVSGSLGHDPSIRTFAQSVVSTPLNPFPDLQSRVQLPRPAARSRSRSPPTLTKPPIRSRTPPATAAHTELYRNPGSRVARRQLLAARMRRHRAEMEAAESRVMAAEARAAVARDEEEMIRLEFEGEEMARLELEDEEMKD